MSKLKQNKTLIIFILLILAVIAGLFYFTSNNNQEAVNTNITPTLSSPPSVAVSSPISPNSPLPSSDSSTGKVNLTEYEIALILAGQMMQSGNYQGAIIEYNSAINIDPEQAVPYDARGSAYFVLNDYTNALDDYSKAIELDQDYAQAYYNRGRVYSLLKRYDEALPDLEKSIELAPDEFGYRAYGNIGLIYHQQGKYDIALETFEKSMSYNNTKADVFYLRGETYTTLENYEAAIADYEAAIARFSQYHLAYQSLGYAYYKIGQFDQALEALNQAISISSSNNSPTPHLYLGLVYLATDDLNQAETEFSQAMTLSNNLSPEEQSVAYRRVLTELEFFAKEHPDKSEVIKSLESLIPEVQ